MKAARAKGERFDMGGGYRMMTATAVPILSPYRSWNCAVTNPPPALSRLVRRIAENFSIAPTISLPKYCGAGFTLHLL